MRADKPRSTIAKLRRRNGLSQRELAEKLGITIQTVSNWERDRVDLLPWQTVIKLCEVFKCEAKDLIEYPNQALEDNCFELEKMRECIGTGENPNEHEITSSNNSQELENNESSN